MSRIKKKITLTEDLEGDKEVRYGGVAMFGITLILVFSVIAYGAVDTGAQVLIAVFLAVIVAFWFFDTWSKGEFAYDTNLLQIPLIGLILIGLIQMLPFRSVAGTAGLLSVPPVSSLSLAPYSTWLAVAQLVLYLVFFAAALRFLDTRERVKKVVLVIIIFFALMAFFGILQRLASTDGMIYGVRNSAHGSAFGSFINQHHFAAILEMAIGLPLALLFGKATKKNKRILLLTSAVLMGMAVIFTSSRAGFLSLVGVLLFILAVNFLRKKDKVRPEDADPDEEKWEKADSFKGNFSLVGGGLALLIIILGVVLLLGGDQALIRGVGMQTAGDDFANGRLHFWNVAFQIFKDYPILGSGLDSYGIIFPQYDTWNGVFRVEQAHNDYLQILSDAGIFGLACVAAFVYLLFKKSFQVIVSTNSRFRRHVAIGALAGCFGILIHSFFDFPLRTPANAFLFLILAAFATTTVRHPNSKQAGKGRTGEGEKGRTGVEER